MLTQHQATAVQLLRLDRRFRAVKKAGRQIRSDAARFQYSERAIAIRYELESIRFRVWKSIRINARDDEMLIHVCYYVSHSLCVFYVHVSIRMCGCVSAFVCM